MTNLQILTMLEEGYTVHCRLHGNSMTPRVKSGDLVHIVPVLSYSKTGQTVKKGDVVFCKVNGRFYLHLVTGIAYTGKVPNSYQISNNHGHVNGWTNPKNIFGKLIAVGS